VGLSSHSVQWRLVAHLWALVDRLADQRPAAPKLGGEVLEHCVKAGLLAEPVCPLLTCPAAVTGTCGVDHLGRADRAAPTDAVAAV
jgi:hypothetical protein